MDCAEIHSEIHRRGSKDSNYETHFETHSETPRFTVEIHIETHIHCALEVPALRDHFRPPLSGSDPAEGACSRFGIHVDQII